MDTTTTKTDRFFACNRTNGMRLREATAEEIAIWRAQPRNAPHKVEDFWCVNWPVSDEIFVEHAWE